VPVDCGAYCTSPARLASASEIAVASRSLDKTAPIENNSTEKHPRTEQKLNVDPCRALPR